MTSPEVAAVLRKAAEHTPGPWVFQGFHRASGMYAVGPRETGFVGLFRGEHNARRGAAAPDLLAFAQYVKGVASGQHADPEAALRDLLAQAEAHIAKATGASQ